jgi:hypothetical protein
MSAANEQRKPRTLYRHAVAAAASNSVVAPDASQPVASQGNQQSIQPQVAPPQISDQQREINARTEKGKFILDALTPAKRLAVDKILKSIDLKTSCAPEIVGELVNDASRVKERGDPGFLADIPCTVDIYNVPKQVETFQLGKLLSKIDPEMDIAALVSSTQFYPPTPQSPDVQQIRLHDVCLTQAAIDWIEGRRETNDPLVDNFELYKLESPFHEDGHEPPGKLTVMSNKVLSAALEIGEIVGISVFKQERWLRNKMNNSLEGVALRNKIRATHIQRAILKPGARPVSQPIGKARITVRVDDESIAETLSLHSPGASVGVGKLLHTTVALRLLRKQDDLAAGHDQRISDARKSMRELAETFDPPRIVRELEIYLEVDTDMRNKSLSAIRLTFIADIGAT